VCDLETSRIGAPYIYNISHLRVKSDLKRHAKTAHPKHVLEVTTFISYGLSAGLAIISCFGELYTYYKQIKEGRMYVAVQLIGTSSKASKYKCEFTLHAANGIEQISNTFLVQGYSEDFETIFNSGECLNLDEETLKHFAEENKLNLTITLSRV
jgi:hypothetical protein